MYSGPNYTQFSLKAVLSTNVENAIVSENNKGGVDYYLSNWMIFSTPVPSMACKVEKLHTF